MIRKKNLIKLFYTHLHLVTMIYIHVCEFDGFGHLNQSTVENLNHIIPEISLVRLSNHNNDRDHKVFLPIMNEFIKRALTILTKNKRLNKVGTIKMIDYTTFSMHLTFFSWQNLKVLRLVSKYTQALIILSVYQIVSFFLC